MVVHSRDLGSGSDSVADEHRPNKTVKVLLDLFLDRRRRAGRGWGGHGPHRRVHELVQRHDGQDGPDRLRCRGTARTTGLLVAGARTTLPAGNVASTTAISSPWPMSASTSRSSGVNRGSRSSALLLQSLGEDDFAQRPLGAALRTGNELPLTTKVGDSVTVRATPE